jgi:hypothetical protein
MGVVCCSYFFCCLKSHQPPGSLRTLKSHASEGLWKCVLIVGLFRSFSTFHVMVSGRAGGGQPQAAEWRASESAESAAGTQHSPRRDDHGSSCHRLGGFEVSVGPRPRHCQAEPSRPVRPGH